MRYLFSLWMIVLLSSSLSAQSNRFRSGEILLKNGIEKTGFVFGQFNLGAPKGVYFKTSETEKTEYIEFKDIQEVQFGSTERYLTYCTQNTAQQTCHWLKTLLQGKISLHQSVADRGLYFMEDAGTFNAIRQPSFAGTLTLLKRKCPDFVPPADTKFETQNLIQTVVNYNACKNPGDQLKSHYVSTVSKGSWYLGPKAGINLSSASIFKNHYYGLGEYSVAPAFTSGAVIRYQISPNWAVASEVAYFQSSPQSDSVNVWPVVSRNYSKVEMEFAFLEIPVLGQYYFSKGKISPFLQAGIHLGLPIKRTLSEEMFAAEPDELADQPKNSFIGPAVGYGGGLGLNVKLSEKTQVQLLGQYTQWSTTLNSSSRLFESSGFEDKTPINLSRLQIGVQVMLKL